MSLLLPYDQRPYRDCVGCALFNAEGRVFAGKRVDDAAGHWQMPQGGIDPGETPLVAALRELKEETGTDRAEILSDLGRWLQYDLPADIADRVWKGRFRGQRQRWFALRFTGRDADFDLAQHHPEFSEWRWMNLADLPATAIGFKRDIYAEIAAAFAPYARPVR